MTCGHQQQQQTSAAGEPHGDMHGVQLRSRALRSAAAPKRARPRANRTNGRRRRRRRAARAAVRAAGRRSRGPDCVRCRGSSAARSRRDTRRTAAGRHRLPPATHINTRRPTERANYQSPDAKCICRVGFRRSFDFSGIGASRDGFRLSAGWFVIFVGTDAHALSVQ